jgi:dethiobiotin synthetase
MSALFVTATGTDIGKTFVTAGLIRYWHSTGHPIAALKPVTTGFDPAEAIGSDPALLLKALGKPPDLAEIERICPWRYAAPLSPDIASRRERRTLPFDDLVAFSKKAVAEHSGTLLIEGVGGVMVPLDDKHTVLDWMMALKVPLLLVTGTYLGTLSHTLTALDVLDRRKLKVKAVVVNETPGSSVAMADTIERLKCFAPSVPVVGLKRMPEPGAFKPIADLLLGEKVA